MALRGLLWSGFLSLLALCAGITHGQAADLTEVISEADKSVGRVILMRDGETVSTGSGFVIGWDSNGNSVFLTNHHVVSAGPDILVVFPNGKTEIAVFTAQVIATSDGLDMSVLVLFPEDIGSFVPSVLPLTVREIAKGESVTALGFPATSDWVLGSDNENIALFETTLTQGLVSKVFISTWGQGGASEELEIVQHTATVYFGNSGGPLLDECGQAVGMNTAVLEAGGGTSLASSSRSLAAFLDAAQVSYSASMSKCGAAVEPGFTTDPMAQTAEAEMQPEPEQLMPQVVRDAIWQNVLLTAGIGLLLGLVITFAVLASRSSAAPPPSGAIALSVRLHNPTSGWSAQRSLTMAALRKGIVLGRGRDADIDVDVAGISRQHARLRIEDRKLMLNDLGSTNGTTVDGAPLREGQSRQVNSGSAVVLAGCVTVQLGPKT